MFFEGDRILGVVMLRCSARVLHIFTVIAICFIPDGLDGNSGSSRSATRQRLQEYELSDINFLESRWLGSNKSTRSRALTAGGDHQPKNLVAKQDIKRVYVGSEATAEVLSEVPRESASEVVYLPPSDASRLAAQYAPHLCWDLGEPYFNVPVEWINRDMREFSPLAPDWVEFMVPFYCILDASGEVLYSGKLNLTLLGGAFPTAHHLGWGPNALWFPEDPLPGQEHVLTRVPFDQDSLPWELTYWRRDCYAANDFRECSDSPCRQLHIFGNMEAGPDVPMYYWAFYNTDGNIEINYRGFAYRDDIADPCMVANDLADYFGGHWGDWEPNITIVLSPDEIPLYTYYSAHRVNQTDERLLYRMDSIHHPRYVLWGDVRKDLDGHPIVLVASSKHAAFYTSWAYRVPNLTPLASSSPFDPSAPVRLQYLNVAEYVGFSEDRVGESFSPVPNVGDVYLGEHWIPNEFVNIAEQPWSQFEGKWGESPNSPSLPRPAYHTFRDFVFHYDYANSFMEALGATLVDFYAVDGPRWANDIDISGGTVYHNVYHSALKPLGFTVTREHYHDIRFKWYNDLYFRSGISVARQERTISASYNIVNKMNRDVLSLFLETWFDGELLDRGEYWFDPGDFEPGQDGFDFSRYIPLNELPQSCAELMVKIVGEVDLPSAHFFVPIDSAVTVVDLEPPWIECPERYLHIEIPDSNLSSHVDLIEGEILAATAYGDNQEGEIAVAISFVDEIEIWYNPIRITVTDAFGNQRTCSTVVRVTVTSAFEITRFTAIRGVVGAIVDVSANHDSGLLDLRLWRGSAESDRELAAALELSDGFFSRYVDRMAPLGRILYWLEVIRDDGIYWHGPIELQESADRQVGLGKVFPNPSNSQVMVGCYVERTCEIRIDVYSMSGEKVAEIVNEVCEPGGYHYEWDMRDSHGKRVGSGMYILRMDAAGEISKKKLTIVR